MTPDTGAPGDGIGRREFLAAAGMGLLGGLSGCTASMERHGIVATEEDPESRSRTGSLTGRDSTADAAEDASPPGLGSAATELYHETITSVVGILVYDESGRAATGSGFVTGLGPGGPHVVTNQHVVGDAETVDVRFENGEWRSAGVTATDVYADLAVLSTDVPEYARPLSFVDSIPAVGTEVLALGSP